MTSPQVQEASHVLLECSDAGPSYSVESAQSCMGSEKLIPSPPCVEDILDWEWVNTEFKSDIAPQCNNWFPHSQEQIPSGRLGLSI